MRSDHPEHYQMPERPEREAFCERCGRDHPSVHARTEFLCAACAEDCGEVLPEWVPAILAPIEHERRERMEADLRAVERLAKSLRGKKSAILEKARAAK